MKDWKDRHHHTRSKYSKACIILATTTEASSFRLEQIRPNAYSQGMNYQPSDQGVIHDRPSDAARLMFRSPWPSILIELLSGEQIRPIDSWIYPFKHIIVYEKQIRKCVELLNEMNVDAVEAKNLSLDLNRIVSKVVRILGPKRDDVELSDSYVSDVLQKSDSFKNHNLKVKQSLPKDQEEELEDDTEAELGLSSISPGDDPITKVPERSNLAPEAKPAPEEIPYMCTCLKDARDHLQLLVNMIDSHLGSLLALRNAIRDRAVSKIRFEHLWHLFQPGDLVVTSRQPHQAYRVIHVSGGRPLLTTTDIAREDKDTEAGQIFHRQSQVPPFNIDCVKIDFDGDNFGPVQDTVSILEYEEDRMITKLEVYPMNYAEKGQELATVLLDRGRRFAEYRNFKHKRYEGLSLGEPPEEVSKIRELFKLNRMLMIVSRTKIESEVIIDFTQSFRQPDYAKHKPQIGLRGGSWADEREVYEDRCPAEIKPCLRMDHNSLVDDTEFDKLQMERFLNVEAHGMFFESRGGSQILTEDQLILLPYRVQGFSLRSRKWRMSVLAINEGSVVLTYGYSPIEHRSSPRYQGK